MFHQWKQTRKYFICHLFILFIVLEGNFSTLFDPSGDWCTYKHSFRGVDLIMRHTHLGHTWSSGMGVTELGPGCTSGVDVVKHCLGTPPAHIISWGLNLQPSNYWSKCLTSSSVLHNNDETYTLFKLNLVPQYSVPRWMRTLTSISLIFPAQLSNISSVQQVSYVSWIYHSLISYNLFLSCSLL